MTTEEKLFVQIFERKNSIIEQVKQQTDLYIQNLASKLLIDGITPPPWLWNPSPSDPNEFNKEELISKLLLQNSRHEAPYVGHGPVYDKPVVSRDNTEISGRYYMDTHGSSKKINESISMIETRDNDVGCALNDVPEVDFSVNSPQDELDTRISNIYSAPDQSLARIYRSRSRQKALELRTSAKAAAESREDHEKKTGIYFSEKSMPRINFSQDKSSLKSAKHYDVSGKNTESTREANEGNGGVLLQSAHGNSVVKEMTNTSDARSGSSVAREATDGKCYNKQQGSEFCGRMTRSRSSSLQAHFINRSSQLGSSSYTAATDCDTVAQSMHKSAEQVVYSDKLQKAATSSCELVGRMTRSQTTSRTENASLPVKSSDIGSHPITRSRSVTPKESSLAKSLNKNEGLSLPNVSGCQIIPLCPIDVNQHGNTEMDNQLVIGQAESQPLCLRSNLDGASFRKGSEGLVLNPSSKCHMVVQPKQLDFGDIEECTLSNNSSLLRKRRVNRSSGERSSALLDAPASPDDVTRDNANEDFWEERSHSLSNVPTILEEAQNDVSLECSEDEIGKFGFKVNSSPVENTGSKVNKSPLEDTGEVIKGYCPSPKLQSEEVEFCSKEKDDCVTTPSKSIPNLAEPSIISTLVKQRIDDFQNFLDKEMEFSKSAEFNAATQLHLQDMQDSLHVENTDISPEKMLVENNTDVAEGGVSAHCLIGPQCADESNVSFTGQSEIQFTKSSLLPKMKLNPTKGESWPQSKRRKIENTLFSGFSASPSFRAQIPNNIRRSKCKYLENNGSISDSGQELQILTLSEEGKLSQPNANKSSDVGTYNEIQYPMTSDIDFSPSLHVKEGEFGSEGDNIAVGTPFTFSDQQTIPSHWRSLTQKAADGYAYCLSESVMTANPTSTHFDAKDWCPGNKVNEVNDDNLTVERNFSKRISRVTMNGLQSYLSARSPHNDRDSVASDKTMPVFEGFIIDGQTENRLDHSGKLDFPSTSEHARILEEICRSANIQTPLSNFSSKYKVPEIHDLYQSVPNGLLEREDLKSILPLDMDAHKLRASYSCVEEVKTSLHGVPFSNSLSYSGTPFGYNSRNRYASPVGKLWERFSSSSSGSEKRLSSNPELTCFPIEEDPSVSEENENAEADEIQEDIVSEVPTDSAKRQPLVEIAEAYLDPSQLMSAKHPNRDSIDSVTTELSFHGTHKQVKQKPRNHWSNKKSINEGKENQTSLGDQSSKKVIKSLHSRFSKPKLSGKTSLRKGVERLSQKESKHNNIVTGVTSFIPLVQQKQAAAICPAKRDIKVPALAAAEARKRLEEKRENERRMKKEALKLERARIEKDNLKEIELNKKKKQEEQKKRDADVAARKRLRDEEERKEKQKKMKRLADGRRELKLAEEKLRTGKVEKYKDGKMDEKLKCRQETGNPLEKNKNDVNGRGGENCLKKPNSDPQSSYVLEDTDASSNIEGKKMNMLEITPERSDSATVRSQEKSYDISPYQCSDDEEEEDDIPTTKYIPSWASVDIDMSLQNQLDPDTIFPRESFCRMDEVLLPRRLNVI